MAAEGITTRHSRGCGFRETARCAGKPICRPAFQAAAWSVRDRKRIYKTFATLAAAKAWRRDTASGLEKGTVRVQKPPKLREAADELITGMRSGAIRNSSGDPYKPSAVRGYEQALTNRILEAGDRRQLALGDRRLSDIDRGDLLGLSEAMLAEGRDPSTIRNTLMPLRVIYRRALDRGQVAVNPTTGLKLPAVRGKRERIASSSEATKLLAAVRDEDRPLWATAFYAGLRLGELQALRWSDVDLERRVISVARSWDPREGVIEPKTANSTRTVPIASTLRELLLEHRLRQGRGGLGLVFGRTVAKPFHPGTLQRWADLAWEAAGCNRITLHECRHTFASLMIDAGFNVKAISSYIGHASVTITLDRYGHLMPEHEQGAGERLDAYLDREDRSRRLESV